MSERVAGQSEAHLVLQQRIPEGFSATPAEHRWHKSPDHAPVVVTTMTAAEAFKEVEALRAKAPERKDTEYRVVLLNTERTGWVVA